ncbi:hypothetical protein Ptr902_12017 [Pyrenophora tritici-repentis]|nr:hypothetical protein Ptr902_12017 [Pyrenophora tritici-repentis]
MPSYVTRAPPIRTVNLATSFSTCYNTFNFNTPSHPVCKMKSNTRIEYSDELEALTSKLRQDAPQQSFGSVDIPSGRSHVTFNIQQHTDIINFMKETQTKSYSHAFGAVFGPGATILSGPFSYAIAILESSDDLEYTIGGKAPARCNLIHGYQGCLTIQVEVGQLVGMVFAWKA